MYNTPLFRPLLFPFRPLLFSCDLLTLNRAVFAWIFHSWALLAVTPMYLYMVWGLEDAGFVKDDLEESEKQRTALSAPLGGAAAPLGSEQDSMKRH